MKIAIYTLGCKLNQAESDELKETLQKEGFFIVGWKNKADIYIVNACSLTVGAEQGTRQIIRQVKNWNPNAKIFVTGCLRQKLPEIDFYTQNQNELIKKIKITASSHSKRHDHRIVSKNVQDCSGAKMPRDNEGNAENRTRAFIKIQTGCDNFCSFCIIPYFRGKPRSVSAIKIIKTINQKINQGFKEIVLTGVNICKYSDRDCLHFNAAASKCKQSAKPLNLARLAKKILNETKIQRIRFGSLDPSLIDDDFIALFQNPRVMPHMHLSLQSGSSRILKLMNRKYTAKQYLSLIKKIKKRFPFVGFTTDIIVGFPSESEKDFCDTCNLIKKVGFLKVHIFPFSPRPGTPAFCAIPQINEKIKKERFGNLKRIADTARKQFIKKMIGQNVPVLFEEKVNGVWFGYAPNYLRIKLKSKENFKNQIKNLTIKHQNIVN